MEICMKLLLTLGLMAATVPAFAATNLITNGDFETGTYTGWNANVQAGSSGALNVVANGSNSPISGFFIPANGTGGNYFSITDQLGPGSYSLTQSFTLGSAAQVKVSFDQFLGDRGGFFPNGRDYTTIPNQNAVVDILINGADPFTNSASDIVAVLWGPAGFLDEAWQHYSSTLNLAAGTYQLRFAETDNQSYFQQAIDNVVVDAVAEPGTVALMLLGVAAIALGKRRAR
jgi:hypothetical protein